MTTDKPIPVAPYDGPDLVYGLWRDTYLVVIGREWATAAAAEIDSIVDAATWREAFEASQAVTHVWGPIDEDVLEEHKPGDPFDRDEIPGWIDGDWPPMVSLYTSEYLPEDWPIGDAYSTTFNGEGFVIAPEDEQRLLAIAELAGATLTRDDSALARLDPQWP